MRKFVNNLYQEVCKFLKLNLKETTILEYLLDFINSGYMQSKIIDNEKYFWISYEKILEDLPILNVEKRRLARIIQGIQSKGVIEIKHKCGNKVYIRFNPAFLDGSMLYEDEPKVHADVPESTSVGGSDVLFGQSGVQKSTPIVKLDRKKIIFNIEECAREGIFSKYKLLQLILEEFKPLIPAATYSCLVKDDLKVEDITDRDVILSSAYSVVAEEYINCLKIAFNRAIKKFNSQSLLYSISEQ